MIASGGLFSQGDVEEHVSDAGFRTPASNGTDEQSNTLVARLGETEVLSDRAQPTVKVGDRGMTVVEPVQCGDEPWIYPGRGLSHPLERAAESVPCLDPNRADFATQCCRLRRRGS